MNSVSNLLRTPTEVSVLSEILTSPPKLPLYAAWNDIFSAYEEVFPWLSQSIIKQQYIEFKKGTSPIIAAEEVKFMAFQKSRSSPNVINLKKTNYFKFFYINFTFISSIFPKK